MIKIQSLILLALFVSACGSAPVPENKPEESMPDTAMTETTSVNKSEPMNVPKQVTPAAQKSNLIDAIKSGQDESIYRASTQALAQNSGDVQALNALGMYYYRKNQLLAASYMFNKALKISPDSSELHNNLGLIHLGMKEKRDAIKSFRKAMELNPSNADAAANLGALYVEARDFVKATVPLEIAAQKYSKDVRVLNNYAVALANSGKADQAKGLYKDALRINSNSKETLFNYATLLVDYLKQNQDGLEIINKLKFLGPAQDIRNRMNALENRAKAGLK